MLRNHTCCLEVSECQKNHSGPNIEEFLCTGIVFLGIVLIMPRKALLSTDLDLSMENCQDQNCSSSGSSGSSGSSSSSSGSSGSSSSSSSSIR